jgi:predicted transcriptional regulator
MRRSMFEIKLAVLKTLAYNGPLRITHIMYKANLNCSYLKEILQLLFQQNLIERKKQNETKTVYSVTEKGRKCLKYIREMETMMQVGTHESLNLKIGGVYHLGRAPSELWILKAQQSIRR